MPSYVHEFLVMLFRDRPALAAELLSGAAGVDVPEFEQARVSSGDLTDVAPTEYRADAVVTLDGSDGPVFAVVVEIQLRPDVRKLRTWPAYVATLHARMGCPVALLVVCANDAVARWCSTPIVIGPPGSRLTPVAFGPNHIPVVTDEAAARRSPELAVLSAVAHATDADPTPVFKAMLAAFEVFDHDLAALYTDFVFAVLPLAARAHLEDLMTTSPHRYRSEFAQRYFGQGEATALLKILDRRGIAIPDEIRTRITECTDLDQLDRWIDQAATAEKVDDIEF